MFVNRQLVLKVFYEIYGYKENKKKYTVQIFG